MLRRSLLQVARHPSVCVFCASRSLRQPHVRLFSAAAARFDSQNSLKDAPDGTKSDWTSNKNKESGHGETRKGRRRARKRERATGRKTNSREIRTPIRKIQGDSTLPGKRIRLIQGNTTRKIEGNSTLPENGDDTHPVKGQDKPPPRKPRRTRQTSPAEVNEAAIEGPSVEEAAPLSPVQSTSLKEALLASAGTSKKKKAALGPLEIHNLNADDLALEPIPHDIPPVPKLSHGLDRVLFNSGVYRLQDPRSRVYNFDPYLEKIMPVTEFDFNALSEYKTSSKDSDLLTMNQRLGTKFTGSTSSMSGVLQHFHFLLSGFRDLNHDMLSRKFPLSNKKFSKITLGPSAIFLRWKGGRYAIDADKSFDSPNLMSWLGHSLEKLLTNSKEDFEKYRRSSPEAAPSEDDSGKCFHYTRLGNFLMRSQLDAQDARLPGTGVFDLKTRAVVSIRMDSDQYETGSGYQIRYDQGQWESYEREVYDMTRATLLKYSLQVRMGRMDGIFVAYHNIERIFGFQYFSLADMDNILHGQTDSCLGDQEFKFSVSLLDDLLQRATEKFPETSLRLHFESIEKDTPYMYVFAVPVTEEEADQIQDSRSEARKEFERNVIGVKKDDPEVQAEWQDIQSRVDEEVEASEGEDEALEAEVKVQNEVQSAVEKDSEQQASQEAKAADPADDVEGVPGQRASAALMGWTLTIRNRVNGAYTNQPKNLEPSDNWSIEYHVQEIGEDTRRKAYDKLLNRRKKLIGEDKEVRDRALKVYRELIREYSISGRQWREQQDRIDAEIGQRVFRPMGPGSEGS
ncbi:Pet127-domain-containing protein [Lophiostoma macrostomum CBS 122681]|uniref:Pet127-domain-containing protein n=1 Tax=Lophiostoma macrostomum CBS 122681 TaxID=1314788 RepID=A0A6A6SZG2_9PLEO|nr:Pet127-domain-containing protein [Lophiostoma macrostomum CBS 122681]